MKTPGINSARAGLGVALFFALFAFSTGLWAEAGASSDEALFIIHSRRSLDPAVLQSRGEVLQYRDRTALLRTTQESAELLSASGLEITRVMPPHSRSAPTVPILLPRRSAPAELVVQGFIERITAGKLDALLGDLSGENSVQVGGVVRMIETRNSYQTDGITWATQYGYEFFQALGLPVEYDDYSWSGHQWRNVVAEQPGAVNPGNVFIICGHLDDMPSGPRAPGADDNASGAAAVLAAAEALAGHRFENTIRYVLFTGEEQGLIGSRYYVEDCLGEGDRILGALNFDMIAYDSNADGQAEVYCGTTPLSNSLGDLFIDTIDTYYLSLNPVRYASEPSWSDQYRFWEAGYPAMAGIESFSDFNPNYHTINDTRANCNIVFMTEFVRAAVGTLARLAVPEISPMPTPARPVIESGDYNGDGTSEIAVFRETSGLWAIRGVTRVYWGRPGDLPVPGDYAGDGTTGIGTYRPATGLWLVRDLTRIYWGRPGDIPLPVRFNPSSAGSVGIFRPSSGLWAIRGTTRVYWGRSEDRPVPGDYRGDGTIEIATYRPPIGSWLIRNLTRVYWGRAGDDLPIPGDYNGDETTDIGVYRAYSGLWAIRGITRAYWGRPGDVPVPGDYAGDRSDVFGTYRPLTGCWSIRGLTRVYWGRSGDLPVSR